MSRIKDFLEHSEEDNSLNNTLNKIISYAGFFAIGIVVGYLLSIIFG